VDDTNLPRELAERFVQLLKERTATNDSDDVRERFQRTYELMEGFLQSKINEERNRYFHALGQQLADPKLPMWEFACVANTCGIGVENGSDPGYCISPILDRLTTQFQGCPELHQKLNELIGTSDLETIAEDQWDVLAGRTTETALRMREFLSIGFNGRAAMTMLCRSSKLRHSARERTELVEAATGGRAFNRYAHFVAEVLQATDDEDIIVIDLARKIGFLTRLNGVRNNAQLFTLLQASLLQHPSYQSWPGKKPHPLLISIARGQRMIDTISAEEWTATGLMNEKGEVYDQGIWQFYQWPALQPDSSVETWQKANPYHPWWVWGEMLPNDIVEIDGVKIVLLSEPEMPRQWAIGFFAPIHPAFESEVVLRSQLSPESVESWLERIRSMPREPNPLPPMNTNVEEPTVAV
jgi:hypothetical protein